MANILVNVEKGIEIGAEDLLKWITDAQNKAPAAIAALGTLLGAVSTAVSSTEAAAAASGLNIQLDATAWANIKAAWPELVAFVETLGIKV